MINSTLCCSRLCSSGSPWPLTPPDGCSRCSGGTCRRSSRCAARASRRSPTTRCSASTFSASGRSPAAPAPTRTPTPTQAGATSPYQYFCPRSTLLLSVQYMYSVSICTRASHLCEYANSQATPVAERGSGRGRRTRNDARDRRVQRRFGEHKQLGPGALVLGRGPRLHRRAGLAPSAQCVPFSFFHSFLCFPFRSRLVLF